MPDLEAKFTELQALLTAQHNALMALLSDRLPSMDQHLFLMSSRLTTLVSQGNQAATSRSNLLTQLINANTSNGLQLASLSSINAALNGAYGALEAASVGVSVARSVLALENIAVSNNGNNTVLQALDSTSLQTNRILERLADCGCNNGEPTPTSLECLGDYRRVTLYRGDVSQGISAFGSAKVNGGSAVQYISYVSDIANANMLPAVVYNNLSFETAQINIIEVPVGAAYCIENIGTQPIEVLYVGADLGQTAWGSEIVPPGDYMGVNSNTFESRRSFIVTSNVSATNPDAFKVLVFYEPPPV